MSTWPVLKYFLYVPTFFFGEVYILFFTSSNFD